MIRRYRPPDAGLIEQTAILTDMELPAVEVGAGEQAKVVLTNYPWLLVLTQECDLQFDRLARAGLPLKEGGIPVKRHHLLLSILLCPAFPLDHVTAGVYIPEARKWGSDERKILLQNQSERHHLLPAEGPLVEESLVLDFKLVVGVHPFFLQQWINEHPDKVVAVLNPPYRDRLMQRFVNYLARIAEPDAE